MPRFSSQVVLALVVAAATVPTVGAEYVSDLISGPADEGRALNIKAKQFWGGLLQAAEGMKMEEHVALYADTKAAIESLPTQNLYVREALTEVLERLKRADEALLLQLSPSMSLAEDRLRGPAGGAPSLFGSLGNFFSGGDRNSFISSTIREFTSEGRYSSRLQGHVKDRMADILPVLQGTAGVTGSLLQDCRLASKRSFDLLKYDIYNKGVPKTPKPIKALAYRLIDAAGETRHKFTNFIVGAVNGITRDVQSKHDTPAQIVTQENLRGLHSAVAAAEATLPSAGRSLGGGAMPRAPPAGIGYASLGAEQIISL